MRLLNVDTQRLETTTKRPQLLSYTILSHTWGEGEISFQDLTSTTENYKAMAGYAKLLGCCEKSSHEGFQYTWIDTCCIDKSSSAELSEAINSMFDWYSKAQVCYAFLSDVDGLGIDEPSQPSSTFRKSRWFQRGWTLQELLAPQEVVFFNKDWIEIGTKKSLGPVVGEITGIAKAALEKPLCGSETCPHVCTRQSLAQKMSWAALRITTREEDRAYCLMGLFGVNMPLLYGEGGEKAFLRLLQEIMRQSSDDSVFAWSLFGCQKWAGVFFAEEYMQKQGFIAWRPELFYSGLGVYTAWAANVFATLSGSEWTPATLSHGSTTYEETKQYLSLTAPILTLEDLRGTSEVRVFTFLQNKAEFERSSWRYGQLANTSVEAMLSESRVIAVLSCCFHFGRVGIVLQRSQDGTYSRFHNPSIVGVQFSELPERRTINIRHREGLGVECNLTTTLSIKSLVTELEVVLVEGNGYFTVDKISESSVLSKYKPSGTWTHTGKGDRVIFFFPPYMCRVALLYGDESDDDTGSGPYFVLAFKWEDGAELEFTGATVSNDKVDERGWAENLDWDSDWWEPGQRKFTIQAGRQVSVTMRRAPGRMGQCWYAFVHVIKSV